MQTDTKRILLHLIETDKEELQIISDMARNNVLLIEALRKRNDPAVVAAASGAVDATADAVLGLSDRLERLADQVRRHC